MFDTFSFKFPHDSSAPKYYDLSSAPQMAQYNNARELNFTTHKINYEDLKTFYNDLSLYIIKYLNKKNYFYECDLIKNINFYLLIKNNFRNKNNGILDYIKTLIFKELEYLILNYILNVRDGEEFMRLNFNRLTINRTEESDEKSIFNIYNYDIYGQKNDINYILYYLFSVNNKKYIELLYNYILINFINFYYFEENEGQITIKDRERINYIYLKYINESEKILYYNREIKKDINRLIYEIYGIYYNYNIAIEQDISEFDLNIFNVSLNLYIKELYNLLDYEEEQEEEEGEEWEELQEESETDEEPPEEYKEINGKEEGEPLIYVYSIGDFKNLLIYNNKYYNTEEEYGNCDICLDNKTLYKFVGSCCSSSSFCLTCIYKTNKNFDYIKCLICRNKKKHINRKKNIYKKVILK